MSVSLRVLDDSFTLFSFHSYVDFLTDANLLQVLENLDV